MKGNQALHTAGVSVYDNECPCHEWADGPVNQTDRCLSLLIHCTDSGLMTQEGLRHLSIRRHPITVLFQERPPQKQDVFFSVRVKV